MPGGWAVYNNTLYIFGGFSSLANGGTGGVFTDTWKFDPMAPTGSKWTQLASAQPEPGPGLQRRGRSWTAMIYAIGGDIWTGTATHAGAGDQRRAHGPQPGPTRPGRGGQPARQRGVIWAPGPIIPGSPTRSRARSPWPAGTTIRPDNQGYLYTPGTNCGASSPIWSTPRAITAIAQLNGFLYALGGYDYTNNLPDGANFNQRYDATGPAGTATPTVTGTPPMRRTNTDTHYTPSAATSTRTPTPSAGAQSAAAPTEALKVGR